MDFSLSQLIAVAVSTMGMTIAVTTASIAQQAGESFAGNRWRRSSWKYLLFIAVTGLVLIIAGAIMFAASPGAENDYYLF